VVSDEPRHSVLLTNGAFLLALLLVFVDSRWPITFGGIPSFLVAAFLSYAVAWDLALLLAARRTHTSDLLSTSLALLTVGCIFFFGRTDMVVASMIANKEEGQRIAYESFLWKFNDIVLLLLSIGTMMGLLVIAVAVLSYLGRVRWKQAMIGVLASVVVGTICGIGFGSITMFPVREVWQLAPVLVVSLWIGTLIMGSQFGNLQRSIFGVLATAATAMALLLILGSGLEAILLVTAGAVLGISVQALLGSWSVTVSIPIPENAPKFIWKVGWYCVRFISLGVSVAFLLISKVK